MKRRERSAPIRLSTEGCLICWFSSVIFGGNFLRARRTEERARKGLISIRIDISLPRGLLLILSREVDYAF